MSEGVTIRVARVEDAAVILSIHRASILALGLDGYSQAECESWAFVKVASDYVTAMDMAGERFFLAQRSGEAVGFASYLADRIMAVYVLATAARTGVGSALMAAVEGSIQGNGHKAIYLEASASGRDFYRACGYVEVVELQRASRGGMLLRTVDMMKSMPG